MGGIGKQVFGKVDPSATNTVDSSGNVVSTGTPGGTVVDDPNDGLSWQNKLMRGLVKGTGQGLQNQSQMQTRQGGGARIGMPQQPQLDPAAYGQGGQDNALSPYFYGRR